MIVKLQPYLDQLELLEFKNWERDLNFLLSVIKLLLYYWLKIITKMLWYLI